MNLFAMITAGFEGLIQSWEYRAISITQYHPSSIGYHLVIRDVEFALNELATRRLVVKANESWQ